MPRPTVGVVWFRRDLRLHDLPALEHALERFDRVVPLFVVDPGILRGRWPSANRRWFLAGALRSLRDDVRARGADLGLVVGDPAAAIPRIAEEIGAAAIVVSRDSSPYGRRRDEAVRIAGEARGIAFVAGRGLLAHEPEELPGPTGSGYGAFTPFHRRWAELPLRAVLPAPERIPTVALPEALRGDPVDLIERVAGDAEPTADRALLPEPSERAARERLERWAGSDALLAYDTGRDRLDVDGTSRLSQDLRWGLLSPVEVLVRCSHEGRGPERFRSELAWRDFYAHLLWHHPRIARESFRREMDAVAWEDDRARIEAWKRGRTGYPIVDAAMRQLLASGFMPNRARMIVASFLTKHLGIDWRVGEAHFMEQLLDGDPASNNGGWQWVAGTGVDAQPWFRIFNPTLQGRRHDPDGAYVRRWIPELAARSELIGGDVHEPPPGAYVPPVVDHRAARAAALDRLRRVAR